jgi:hypothetical protein
MVALTEQNDISIAQIAVYLPSLVIAVFLAVRHGFGRNAGWLYLVIFSLVRIVGSALSLATISDPKNISLYIGALTLQNIGLSPLILVQVGLLGRALGSIRKVRETFLNEQQLRLVQLVVIVGLILSAVGGSQAGTEYGKTGVYTVQTLAKVGLALMIVGYVITVICTLVVASQISSAEPGEKRLLLAVGLSLPFVLVRLIYSAMSTLGGNAKFSSVGGDVNIQLGMAIIMEMIAIIIIEAIGLTLKKIPKEYRGSAPSGFSSLPLLGRFSNSRGVHKPVPRYPESEHV